MLGHSLASELPDLGHSVAGCGVIERSSTALPGASEYEEFVFRSWDDFPTLLGQVAASRAEVLIHAAAYTQVDKAEECEDAALVVNGVFAQAAARACEELGIDLVYLSTDYVFDGAAGRPYREGDTPNPLGAYGRTKLAGELAARRIPRHYVVRTSWLFGEHGPNFVTTILRAARERPELRVVADQHGCPTYAADLARALGRLILTRRYGTYHLTNAGVTTWCDFAREIVGRAGLATPVHPQSTAEAGRPAPRPAFAPLDNANWRAAGESPLPPWQDALARFLVRSGLV